MCKKTQYSKDEACNLNESLFLGKGHHKAAYIHPDNPELCVKIVFSLPDTDLTRELKYRKILASQNHTKNLLTKYYGEIETTLGKGFVFDRVVDFDGKTSNNLIWLFENYKQAEALLHDSLFNILSKFRSLMFEENTVLSDTDPINTMIQRLSENEYTFKVIDNIGTPVTIPLAYYFDYFAKKRTQRYWKRFVNTCHNRWPNTMTDSEWKNLL